MKLLRQISQIRPVPWVWFSVETGATAAEGLKNSIGELQPFVSDAFRARLGREMDAVKGLLHSPRKGDTSPLR